MNKIVFLLILLPLFSAAQTEKEETNKPSDGILTLVHADKTVSVPAPKKDDKKDLKNDTKYYGAVQFKIGNNQISCDSAMVHENDNLVDAYNVTISNPEYFTVKGATLNYNKQTKSGTLSSSITVSALNGNLIGTSESLEIDLKNEAYRIGSGNINPPPHKE
jgi:hypothetical protein